MSISTWTLTFKSPPPLVSDVLVSFPAPHILLVTFNRPAQLNSLLIALHPAIEKLWDWYDSEPSLRCAILTGAGRAFCAGADLKEWARHNDGDNGIQEEKPVGRKNVAYRSPAAGGGFGGMSNRAGLKPIIGAVNGLCLGGGMEIAINCDIIIASSSAQFGLPEVTLGVVALAGALPRLVRSLGRQRAAEMALGGARYSAVRMYEWGLVNEVVQINDDDIAVKEDNEEAVRTKVVGRALEWAERISNNSPDAVIVSREGLKLGWEGLGPQAATDMLAKGWYRRIEQGENMTEGLHSFAEKRKPAWKDSKL